MSGPWERYAEPQGPWANYKPKSDEAAPNKTVEAAADTGKWLITQLTKGAVALGTTPAALGDLAERGGAWAGDKVGLPEFGRNAGNMLKQVVNPFGIMPTAEGVNNTIFGGGDSPRPQAKALGLNIPQMGVPEVNAADNPALTLTNPLGYEGKVNLGAMLDTGVQAIPGALALGGGVLPAFLGGVTSEAAGQATEGTPYELPARIVGSLPGAYAGTKLTTPLPSSLSAEQQRLVDIAKQNGVPLTVAQETGRGQRIESALSRFPTSARVMENAADAQRTKIAQMASREAGTTVNDVGPESMNKVAKNASDAFDRAKKFPEAIALNEDFMATAGKKLDDYLSNISTADVVPSIGKRVKELQGMTVETPAGSILPMLTNEQYQEFRRGISLALQNTNKPGAREALKGLRNALDDAAEASLPADKMEAWREARKNWANYKMLSKATANGTADSRSAGTLSPNALTAAVRKDQGVDRFASTTGGMNDVARLSGYLADTMPNSGTPQTLAMQSLLTGGPLAGGYATMGLPGVGLAAAGMAAPNVAARAMTGQGWATPMGPLLPLPASVLRNYLANQALPNTRQSVATVPFALTPNLLTDARVRQ